MRDSSPLSSPPVLVPNPALHELHLKKSSLAYAALGASLTGYHSSSELCSKGSYLERASLTPQGPMWVGAGCGSPFLSLDLCCPLPTSSQGSMGRCGRETGRDLFNLRLLKVSQDCVSGVENLSVSGTRAVQENIHSEGFYGLSGTSVPISVKRQSLSLPPVAVRVKTPAKCTVLSLWKAVGVGGVCGGQGQLLTREALPLTRQMGAW